ncbi:hypothetical protein RND71_021217 [Anisodus tanguticus]|uniref:Uncharacterized protein n=1 Tax=Anisodus tanguticus TaxID=243964 RepID=A0AAE1V736_9SOLA|nr:hypothetical protein RND71_021217 [Anisodus tanguticus]
MNFSRSLRFGYVLKKPNLRRSTDDLVFSEIFSSKMTLKKSNLSIVQDEFHPRFRISAMFLREVKHKA